MAQWLNPRMLIGPRTSIKVITKMALKEEMKVIYDSPKSFQGEKLPRKHPSEVVGNLPVILNTTLKWHHDGESDIG